MSASSDHGIPRSQFRAVIPKENVPGDFNSSGDANYVDRGLQVQSLVLLVTLVIVILSLLSPLIALSLYDASDLYEGDTDRIDCAVNQKEQNSRYSCLNKGCLWYPAKKGPFCFLPKMKFGYRVAKRADAKNLSIVELRHNSEESLFPGKDVEFLRFSVENIASDVVRIKIEDRDFRRYEVPIELNNQPKDSRVKEKNYIVKISGENEKLFYFKVLRNDGTILMDTRIGGLIFTDNFLNLATYLPTPYVYGLGEGAHPSLLRDVNYKTWPLWGRDQRGPGPQKFGHGVHPFYLCLEASGKAHGVLFLNSNAMDFSLLPAPGISFRATGGVLDMYVFVGDSPEDVAVLYANMVGQPAFPPYWALGLQMNLQEDDVDGISSKPLSHDVEFVDAEAFGDGKETSNLESMGSILEQKNGSGVHLGAILVPAVSVQTKGFEQGVTKDVFMTWPSDTPLRQKHPPPVNVSRDLLWGKAWPLTVVVYPDFFKMAAKTWLKNQLQQTYFKDGTLLFEAFHLDLNEPTSFGTNSPSPWFCGGPCWTLHCPRTPLDFNPVASNNTSSQLSDETLCMTAVQGETGEFRHFDVHSVYGLYHAKTVFEALASLSGRRFLLTSRSTFPSIGRYAGHVISETRGTWDQLRASIVGILDFNLFAIPLVGADICGFYDHDTSDELCLRWFQLGAFYPLARQTKDVIGRERPWRVPDSIWEQVSNVIRLRYMLLPYLYRLFYDAHVEGHTVARPVVFEFPTCVECRALDRQFLWGSALLISPIVDESVTSLTFFLPNCTWYDYFTHKVEFKTGVNVTRNNVTSPILHVRGGNIIVTQQLTEGVVSTSQVRDNPFEIRIFYAGRRAQGKLFWDDLESRDTVVSGRYHLFDIVAENCSLKIEQLSKIGHKISIPSVDFILLHGVGPIAKLFSNDVQLKNAQIEYKSDLRFVHIWNISIPLSEISYAKALKLKWENVDGRCLFLT